MVKVTVLPSQEAGQFPELVIRRYEHNNTSAPVRKGLRLTRSISIQEHPGRAKVFVVELHGVF